MSETEQAFRAELRALLARWNAQLSAEDHYPGYAECGEDVRMTVTIPGIYDQFGETVRDREEIDLGRFQDGKPAKPVNNP